MKRLVIQGLGKWGEILVKSLTNSKIAKFTSVVSRNPKSINKIAKKYQLKTYLNMSDAINDDKIDGIVLCTPHSIHSKQIIDYSKYKKPIFVEKPLALKVKDAIKAVKFCKQKRILLAVGQNRRFLPTYNYLRNILTKKNWAKYYISKLIFLVLVVLDMQKVDGDQTLKKAQLVE